MQREIGELWAVPPPAQQINPRCDSLPGIINSSTGRFNRTGGHTAGFRKKPRRAVMAGQDPGRKCHGADIRQANELEEQGA
jgi:hypothetical protein